MIIIEKQLDSSSVTVHIITKDNGLIEVGRITPLIWTDLFRCDDMRLSINNRLQEQVVFVARDVDEYWRAVGALRRHYRTISIRLIGKRRSTFERWMNEEEFRREIKG
jgi:hypothetical protein